MPKTTKASDAMKKLLIPVGAVLLLLLVSVSGCGGSKVLKEPEPLVVTQSLAAASDERLSVTLDWVIVRDGPGTWAKNADWDEYLLHVNNLSDGSLEITDITVLDSLGTRIDTGNSRRKLVKGAKKTKRRYKDEGLKVKAGAGAGTMMVAGAAAWAGAGAVALSGGVLGAASAGATVAATGLILAAPVLAVGGVLRGVNNSKVNNEVESRQTILPLALHENEEKPLDVFFPLTPSPRQIELTYVDSRGEHTLIVDTLTSLEGLHLVQDAE
jgi:hypothetical protein